MKKTLISLHRGLWILIAAVIVVIAIVISLARILTPYIATQRPEIEQKISAYLQQPVQINNFTVRWQRFMPVIKATNVVIYDDQKKYPLLHVDEADIGINLLETLLTGHMQLGSLNVSGATLNVRENSTGHISVDGLGIIFNKQLAQQKSDNLTDFLNFLFIAPHFSFQHITLNWYGKQGDVLLLKDLNLTLHNHWYGHTLWGGAVLAQTQPTELRIVMKMTGDWHSMQKTNINFYADAENIVLAQWLQQHPIAGFTANKGLASVQLWGAWKQGQFDKIQTVFNIKQAEVIKNNNTDQPLLINQGSGNVVWQQEVKNWNVDAQLNDISFSRWNKIPGVSHLNAYVHATPDAGFAHIIANNSQFDFGALFRAPLLLQDSSASVAWQHDAAEGWIIKTGPFQVKTSDAVANGTLNLLLPNDNSSPIINLLVKFTMQGKQHVADYLPITIMSPGLLHWLSNSITHLDAAQATLALRGPLHGFPYDHNEGVFIVDSQVQGLDLKYLPDWPAVTKVNGHLVFAGRAMQFDATSGTIFNSKIQELHAQIPLMEKKVPAILQIQSKLAGNVSDAIKFIQQSPLQKKFSAAQNVQANGDMQLALNLNIPLEHDDKATTKIQGKLALNKTNVIIPTHNITLQNLNGNAQFTDSNISAQNITASLWNKPITINISTPQQTPVIQIQYDDLSAQLQQDNNNWVVNLQSPMLEGQVTVPSDKERPVEVNLQYLYITPNDNQTFKNINPESLPPLLVTINDMRYGAKQFGHVQLQLNPTAGGATISSLQAGTSYFNLTASGTWMGRDTAQQTSVSGTLTSNNVAGLLQSWSFPASIVSSQGAVNFGLAWPGPAYDPSFQNMAGKVSIRVTQGQIVNLDSATAMKMDIGRLLSLLSFQSIERRLKLDFSDLTAKGFSFNNMQADFQIQQGNAYLQNAAKINGPVADIEILGRIGLVAKDYDLMVSVTPQLTSALPIIVGLATGPVGPIAAAATWAATQVVGTAVNKIATDNYRMTGSWSNPNVTPNNGSSSKSSNKLSKAN